MNRGICSIAVFFLAVSVYSCSSQDLNRSLKTEFGVFKFSATDTNTVNDFISACENQIPSICKELEIDYDNQVIIEIYPDQESYNNSIINSAFKNSPAISGNSTIQLVSPLAPLFAETMVGKISYSDRLSFVVHEYTHILLDKLENPPPLCIDEGIASYYSSKRFYTEQASKYLNQIETRPSIEQLISNYHQVPAPDLFSFLLIDFIIQEYGKESLPDIIRNTDNIKQMNDGWAGYLERYEE